MDGRWQVTNQRLHGFSAALPHDVGQCRAPSIQRCPRPRAWCSEMCRNQGASSAKLPPARAEAATGHSKQYTSLFPLEVMMDQIQSAVAGLGLLKLPQLVLDLHLPSVSLQPGPRPHSQEVVSLNPACLFLASSLNEPMPILTGPA